MVRKLTNDKKAGMSLQDSWQAEKDEAGTGVGAGGGRAAPAETELLEDENTERLLDMLDTKDHELVEMSAQLAELNVSSAREIELLRAEVAGYQVHPQ